MFLLLAAVLLFLLHYFHYTFDFFNPFNLLILTILTFIAKGFFSTINDTPVFLSFSCGDIFNSLLPTFPYYSVLRYGFFLYETLKSNLERKIRTPDTKVIQLQRLLQHDQGQYRNLLFLLF